MGCVLFGCLMISLSGSPISESLSKRKISEADRLEQLNSEKEDGDFETAFYHTSPI